MRIGVSLVVWTAAALLVGGCPKKNDGTTPRSRATGGGEAGGDEAGGGETGGGETGGDSGSRARRPALSIPDELLAVQPCKAYLMALRCFVQKMPEPHRRQGVKTFRSIVDTWLKIPEKTRAGACVRSYRKWMLAMQNDLVAIQCIKQAPPP